MPIVLLVPALLGLAFLVTELFVPGGVVGTIGEMDRKLWASLVVERKGVDLLLAPDAGGGRALTAQVPPAWGARWPIPTASNHEFGL